VSQVTTVPVVTHYTCDKPKCEARLDVEAHQFREWARELDAILDDAGWSVWLSSYARHYCPDHEPQPGHKMRRRFPTYSALGGES
jgi:hypothetical protein